MNLQGPFLKIFSLSTIHLEIALNIYLVRGYLGGVLGTAIG